MSETLDPRKLEDLAKEFAKNSKSQDDLAAVSPQLVKLTVETALNAEMEDHLGYSKTKIPILIIIRLRRKQKYIAIYTDSTIPGHRHRSDTNCPINQSCRHRLSTPLHQWSRR